MKSKVWNMVVFWGAMLFLLLGLSGRALPAAWTVIKGYWISLNGGKTQSMAGFTDAVEDSLEENLRYHDKLLDINSVKENLAGTKIIEKPDMTVVKADSGKLVGYLLTTPITEDSLQENVSYVERIQDAARRNKSDFLCCLIPSKACFEAYPPNLTVYNRDNYEKVRDRLLESDVPCLDLMTFFEKKELPIDDLYFDSDHHWTPKTGFTVYQAICEKLKTEYGFSYDPACADLRNFDTELYTDWFLGAYGKKTGRYFSWRGADDFLLIAPKFATALSEEIPAKSMIRTGSFEETMLHKEYLQKDYYSKNTYTTYSGGDYRLQILRNENLPDGPRIVVVRSSYACVVTPFLALQAKEIYVIDDRAGDYPPGEIIDPVQFIDEVKPDYVMILKALDD